MGKWGANFVRHWYKTDKLISVDPNKVPELDGEKLNKYPSAYRYLAYCQEKTMGMKIKLDMPDHRKEGDNVDGRKHDQLYSLIPSRRQLNMPI